MYLIPLAAHIRRVHDLVLVDPDIWSDDEIHTAKNHAEDLLNTLASIQEQRIDT
jgi:hypothetical protein